MVAEVIKQEGAEDQGHSCVEDNFDAVVIGAGPAGAISAYLLAKAGHRVLLVERQKFPRSKVCGCCLSGRGVAALEKLGLISTVDAAVSTEKFVLSSRGRRVTLNSPGGRAISRSRFDSELVSAAIRQGVHFLDATTATVQSCESTGRPVLLKSERESRRVTAQVVLLCSGLGQGTCLPENSSEVIADNPLVGLTAILPKDELNQQQQPIKRTIHMGVASIGYVGMVQLENGDLNVSAAVQRTALKGHRSPGQAVQAILQSAGLPAPAGLEDAHWQGTPSLTRRLTAPAAERLFVVGDAAGYVEPFTGEGMTWAIEAAALVQPLAAAAIIGWEDSLSRQWTVICRKHARQRQRCCRLLKAVLPYPRLISAFIGGLTVFPQAAWPVLRSIHGPVRKLTP